MRLLTALLLCASLSGSALAQGNMYPQAGGGGGNAGGGNNAGGDGSLDQPAQAQDAAKPMDLADAAANAETVVSSFITDRSPKGYWPLREKKSGKLLRLKLESLDGKSVRQSRRPGFYTARAKMMEASGSPYECEFTIDFSGDRWAVTGMRLISPPAKKK